MKNIINSSDKTSWPIYELGENNEGRLLNLSLSRANCIKFFLNLDLPPNNWNHRDSIKYLENLVMSLTLPEFDFSNEGTENWCDVIQDVKHFIDAITSESGINSSLLQTKYSFYRKI